MFLKEHIDSIFLKCVQNNTVILKENKQRIVLSLLFYSATLICMESVEAAIVPANDAVPTTVP